MDEIISIRNVFKTFKGQTKPVLNNLSLSIKSGEIFGLLGPNGAGKTTLLSILFGLLKADSGEIKILDKNIRSKNKQLSKQIGVVPQEYALYPTLTAMENLLYFGSLFDISTKDLKKKIHVGLEEVGLTAFKDKKIETFSGGMKRRINLLAAILHQPKILFLDEPTVGVDVQSKESILNLLKKLNQAGTTILYTSHHLNEAQNLCSRIVIIDEGQIIVEGKPLELIETVSGAENIEDVFINLTGSALRDHA